MSNIKQVGPNHWVGPEDFGFIPNFYITQHGVDHYPNGHLIQQDPLNPGNKKIPLIHRIKEAEDMGEYFDGFSADGHEGFLDMRVQSVHGRGGNVFAVI